MAATLLDLHYAGLLFAGKRQGSISAMKPEQRTCHDRRRRVDIHLDNDGLNDTGTELIIGNHGGDGGLS